MPLDRKALRLIQMTAAVAGPRSAEATAPARRQALASLARMADDPGPDVEATERLIPGPAGPMRLHLYRSPADARRAAPVLAFFHGGGWVAGGHETHDGLCRRLCAASGCRVAMVDYRRAPEHPFPAALEDCLAAVGWIAADGRTIGLDPDRIAVGGDSVGASLAAAVAIAARDQGGPALSLQLLICPILDAAGAGGAIETFGGDSFISGAAFAHDLADYLGPAASAYDPRVSPLRAADFGGLPPAIVETAEYDPFRPEGEAYAEALLAAGVAARIRAHAGMIHYFYALARAIPYAEEAARLIGARLAEAMLQSRTRPARMAAAMEAVSGA